MQIATCNGVTNALQVTHTNGDVYCFHRDAAGTGLIEDLNGTGRLNMLAGSPVVLTTTTGTCPASGGFCPTVITDNLGNPVAAAITVRFRYQVPESDSYQTMTFATTIAPRN